MGSHGNKITRYSTRHLTTWVLTWPNISTSYSGTSVHHHSVSRRLASTTDLPLTQLETSKYSHLPNWNTEESRATEYTLTRIQSSTLYWSPPKGTTNTDSIIGRQTNCCPLLEYILQSIPIPANLSYYTLNSATHPPQTQQLQTQKFLAIINPLTNGHLPWIHSSSFKHILIHYPTSHLAASNKLPGFKCPYRGPP